MESSTIPISALQRTITDRKNCTMTKLNVLELEQDAKEQAEHQTALFSLEDLVAAGAKLEYYVAERNRLIAELEAVNKDINEYETVIIPDALTNLGLKNFTLASGAGIELIDVVAASIKEENKEAAHDWLRKNNHGDIIKNNVTIVFGKGEDKFATKAMKLLLAQREKGSIKFGDIAQKEAVHYQTLQAFVKSQIKNGDTVPVDLFSLYIGQAVKMTK